MEHHWQGSRLLIIVPSDLLRVTAGLGAGEPHVNIRGLLRF